MLDSAQVLAGGDGVVFGCDCRAVAAHVLNLLVQLIDAFIKGFKGVGVEGLSLLVRSCRGSLLRGSRSCCCFGFLCLTRPRGTSGLLGFFGVMLALVSWGHGRYCGSTG
jgi:hypothetical protein